MRKRAVIGLGTTAVALLAASRLRKALGGVAAETGTFTNGMEYARWGDGSKSVLWIPGGPGSDVPRGVMGAMSGAQFRAFVEQDYTVWLVTRRRGMPSGHTVSDMADDYARLIADQFGGRVDVVVGVSYGGMIAQYLAADHPDCFGDIVIALAAHSITDWGRDVDSRWAQARAQGRDAQAAVVMAEYIFPEVGQQRQRQLAGALLRLTVGDEQVPAGDLVVEAAAENAFQAHDILPQISRPVLLISAEKDLFFTPEIVDETVALIPDCTLIRYEGIGHMKAATSGRLARDVLDYVQLSTAHA